MCPLLRVRFCILTAESATYATKVVLTVLRISVVIAVVTTSAIIKTTVANKAPAQRTQYRVPTMLLTLNSISRTFPRPGG